MKCPNCKQTSSYDYPYCPCCGTKQTSTHESDTSQGSTASNEFASSVPKGGESGISCAKCGQQLGHECGVEPTSEPCDFKPFRAWVAWHPQQGECDVALSRGSCERRLTCIEPRNFGTFEEFVIAHEKHLAALLQDGWRVIEVEVKPI